MNTNHGTPRHWRPTQIAKLIGRLAVAVPQAIRQLSREDQDPKRLLNFTSEAERLEHALATMFKMLYNGHAALVPNPAILTIDRDEVFATYTHLWRGPPDGDGLQGKPAEDAKSLDLEQIDFKHLWPQFAPENGIERLDPSWRASAIPLDACIGEELLRQKDHRTLGWIAERYKITEMYFPGSVYYSSQGTPFVTGIRQQNGVWVPCDKPLRGNFNKEQVFLYLN